VSEPAFDSARKAAAEETGQKVLLARQDRKKKERKLHPLDTTRF